MGFLISLNRRILIGMLQRMGYYKVNNIGGIAAYSGKVEK